MPLPSDMIPPDLDPAWMVRKITELERRVTELQAARTAEATSIGAGGLTVTESGTIEFYNADRTRKLMVRDGLMRFFPDLVNAPNAYFFVWAVESSIHQFQMGYVQTEPGEEFGAPYGGEFELLTDSIAITARPGTDGLGEDQSLYLGAVGGWHGVGTIGNLFNPAAAWITERVTGLSAGTTVIPYGITFNTAPRPLVTLKAPAAVAWAVTAYGTSSFTINVATGPAAGTVEVMYWAIRPYLP